MIWKLEHRDGSWVTFRQINPENIEIVTFPATAIPCDPLSRIESVKDARVTWDRWIHWGFVLSGSST